MVTLLLWVAWAGAQPSIVIDARIDDDMQHIRGTISVTGMTDLHLVDPLATLPTPELEVDVVRTFPERPNHGEVTWTQDGDVIRFQTRLPRRFGDTGVTRKGSFANGGWYPQPVTADGIPIAHWDVQLSLPSDAVAALGDTLGRHAVRWRGEGERVSLAVIPRGVITEVRSDHWVVQLLTQGKPRRGMLRELTTQLQIAAIDGSHWRGAVVEAPLRRRLSRPGIGLGYLSDRSWRVFPWFRRLHHEGATRGLIQSWLPQRDPFERSLAAAAVKRIHHARLKRRRGLDLLGLTKWIPAVDAALYDREMSFRSELFRRVHPTDPVQDDLLERLQPATPADVVLAQFHDLHGDTATGQLARYLAAGWSLAQASRAMGLDPQWFTPYRSPYPSTQDYTLHRDEDTITIRREASADAIPEVVVLDIDGARYAHQVDQGPQEIEVAPETRVKRVRLDPQRHLRQRSTVGELQPPPIRWTLSAQISAINVSKKFVSAFGVLTARRADDTFNRWRLWASTNQRAYLNLRLTYTRFAGPIVRGNTRSHGISLSLDSSILNPNFSTSALLSRYTLGGSLFYLFDNRGYTHFPLNGSRVFFGVFAGGAPRVKQSYVRLLASVTGQGALSPRHVIAARVSGGLALTDIPAEQLVFGGRTGVRGLPDDLIQTTHQGILSLEYRAAALRNASVPLGLGYLTELQLIGGLDVGMGASAAAPVTAVSASMGLGAVAEVLGLTPTSAHLTVATPLWTRGIDLPDDRTPIEIYLSWGQTF